MAGDMRLLAAILEIVTELERMGDYAKGIARINLMIGERAAGQAAHRPAGHGQKARDMLHAGAGRLCRARVQAAAAIPAA